MSCGCSETKRFSVKEIRMVLEGRKAVSLWDMISFLAGDLTGALSLLNYWKASVAEAIKESGAGVELPKLERENISDALKQLRPLLEKLLLNASKMQSDTLNRRLAGCVRLSENPACSARAVEVALEDLTMCIEKEVKLIQFAFIPAAKVQYFEQHDLFGEKVSAAFPSAQGELKDAGNCLAADLHTAAVFHLMRAAEHGLRALARHLRVKLTLPLEYACWEDVIRAIDKKLTRLRAKPRGKKKSEALEFYRLTLSECEMLKDVWRNPVSHARRRYTEIEALAVCSRVGEFMRRLSERVKESN